MKLSICLMKRNNKVNISINTKKKLIRQNIYSISSNEIIYHETTRFLSSYETLNSYYDEIYKFTYLGYHIVSSKTNGLLIPLEAYRTKQIS